MTAHRQEFRVSSDTMTIPVTVWSPYGDPADAKRPLLVVHDGPELELKAGLIDKMAWWTNEGSIPPHNVALLSPDDMGNQYRVEHYAASEEYSDLLVNHILPEIIRRAPVDGPIIGMGASLGGLATLHSARAFNGIYSQMASIHHPDYGDEQDYIGEYARHGSVRHYERVKQFVENARHNLVDGDHLTISLTSSSESNYAGNCALYYALRNQGHTLIDGDMPGMQHNYGSWGANFDPSLRDLLLATASLYHNR